jgi:hypothetical protein
MQLSKLYYINRGGSIFDVAYELIIKVMVAYHNNIIVSKEEPSEKEKKIGHVSTMMGNITMLMLCGDNKK